MDTSPARWDPNMHVLRHPWAPTVETEPEKFPEIYVEIPAGKWGKEGSSPEGIFSRPAGSDSPYRGVRGSVRKVTLVA